MPRGHTGSGRAHSLDARRRPWIRPPDRFRERRRASCSDRAGGRVAAGQPASGGILRLVSENAEGSVADGKLRSASTDPAEVRALYDAWADRYDGDLDAWDYRTPTDVAELLRDAHPEAVRVLDVGCGTGRAGRALRAAGFSSIVGCDLSTGALAHAEATGAYERVVEVDLQQLPTPFADDAFDALCCVGVLTYLPDDRGDGAGVLSARAPCRNDRVVATGGCLV